MHKEINWKEIKIWKILIRKRKKLRKTEVIIVGKIWKNYIEKINCVRSNYQRKLRSQKEIRVQVRIV